MNSVVGDGDRVAKRAPVRRYRYRARRLGPLRQFPHARHERGFFRTLHQPDLAMAAAIVITTAVADTPIKEAPDLFLLLLGRRCSTQDTSLSNAPLPHRAT